MSAMTSSSSTRARRRQPRTSRRVAVLIAFEAVTLAVMSALHLSGAISGGRKPYDPTDAGIAEAVICIALVAGAVALRRDPMRGRAVALAATVFAVVGFIAGLTFTIRGGHAVDIAYHATTLPLLIATVVLLARQPAWAGRLLHDVK
jgi:hypothetical protein